MPSEEKVLYSKYSGSSRRLNDAPMSESYCMRSRAGGEITDVAQLISCLAFSNQLYRIEREGSEYYSSSPGYANYWDMQN